MCRSNSHAATTPLVVTLDLSVMSAVELTGFLAALPKDSEAAFVVIAVPTGMPIEEIRVLLARYMQMPVVDLAHGMVIQPRQVFLIPDGQNLVVAKGIFHLIPQENHDHDSSYGQELGEALSVSLSRPEENQSASLFGQLSENAAVEGKQEESDRHLVEQNLRQSEVRYHRLYNKTPVMLHTIDASGTLINVSDYWLRKLGYERQEVLGRKLSEFLTTTSAHHVETVLLPQYSELEVCIDVPYQMVCKNGVILDILLSAIAERDPAGTFARLLTVVVDVSELQRTQQALAHRAAALARSNADLEQFAYVVSHDLQEPLRAMTTFSELLRQSYGTQLDDTAETYLRYIVDGGVRMQQLIDGILSFSRLSYRPQMIEAIDTTAIVETVMQILISPIAETKATMTYSDLPVINGDRHQILQLFQNLISNALKFCGSDPPQIHITAQRQSNGWQFNVQDNGVGIQAEQQSRIFKLFQQLHTHPNTQGHGIGLAICKKIVERHNGQIWVESVPGQGTTFHFTLVTLKTTPGTDE